ncbi:hypothetical protein Tco_0462474 [Tanacetum coccineum]
MVVMMIVGKMVDGECDEEGGGMKEMRGYKCFDDALQDFQVIQLQRVKRGEQAKGVVMLMMVMMIVGKMVDEERDEDGGGMKEMRG